MSAAQSDDDEDLSSFIEEGNTDYESKLTKKQLPYKFLLHISSASIIAGFWTQLHLKCFVSTESSGMTMMVGRTSTAAPESELPMSPMTHDSHYCLHLIVFVDFVLYFIIVC